VAKYKTADIRNIVLCGHGGTGKTMLAEAMLLKAGAINRLGAIDQGTTVSDFDPEEKERQSSLSSSIMHCSFAGKEFNIIDTPGSMDFIGSTISGIAGADLAVICISAIKGVEVMARKAWDLAGERGLGRMVAICRMDGDNVNYQEVLESVQKVFGTKCVPFTIPQGESASFSGVTAVLADGAAGDGVEELRTQITESAIESDDALMEKYLEQGEIPQEQVMGVIQSAIAKGTLVPVFCLAATKDLGVQELMSGIAAWGPNPLHVRRQGLVGEEPVELEPKEEGPLCAQVFKVVSDPHVGKLCYLRVYSGTLAAKTTPFVSSTEKPEKFAQLHRAQGDKREDVPEAIAGDIVGVTKIEELYVGNTIYDKDCKFRFKPLPFPNPMAGLSVSPKSRGDEQKMSGNINRLCEEDPTFIFERREQTNEQVVRGIGQLHLDVMIKRLSQRYGLEVATKPPKIPYLETIAAEADGSYRHKKQTGGAGQFAEGHLRLKPRARGEGFEFVNAIVGGVISGPFIPSVEKGVRKAMAKGILAGYPVVDMAVELFFGKEHPVDSKDIAFQIAGEMGFKEIAQKCKPVLLEPVVNLEIVFPGQYFGDIQGDISSRRGRPTGTDQLGDMQVLKVQAPLVEVADYGSTLNAITQGEGFYSMELSHYEVVPSNIAQQVVARAKGEAEADK